MLMSNDYFRRQPSLQTLRRTTVASLKLSPARIDGKTARGRVEHISTRNRGQSCCCMGAAWLKLAKPSKNNKKTIHLFFYRIP